MYFKLQVSNLNFSLYIGEEDRFRKVSRRMEFTVHVVAIRAQMYQTWFLIYGRVYCFFNESQH